MTINQTHGTHSHKSVGFCDNIERDAAPYKIFMCTMDDLGAANELRRDQVVRVYGYSQEIQEFRERESNL